MILVNVAALFVDARGIYSRFSGVDVWGLERDARKYRGPWRVVAHPPCERWGRYFSGGPRYHGRYRLGEDGGCFESALGSVRAFGGVLEHPAGSRAWPRFGLVQPPAGGGWVPAGDGVGHTCQVWQGHYLHPAPKATWLYACGVPLPALVWGECREVRALVDRSGSVEKRAAQKAAGLLLLSRRARSATPEPFARLLLSMARGEFA